MAKTPDRVIEALKRSGRKELTPDEIEDLYSREPGSVPLGSTPLERRIQTRRIEPSKPAPQAPGRR